MMLELITDGALGLGGFLSPLRGRKPDVLERGLQIFVEFAQNSGALKPQGLGPGCRGNGDIEDIAFEANRSGLASDRISHRFGPVSDHLFKLAAVLPAGLGLQSFNQ